MVEAGSYNIAGIVASKKGSTRGLKEAIDIELKIVKIAISNIDINIEDFR